MLFNTSQISFLTDFVPTVLSQGDYSYYIAYTNTDISQSYNSPIPVDLYVIFSSDKITSNSAYSYNIPANSIVYSVRTVNYSSYSYAVNSDRIVCNSYSSNTLNIPVYEHIYTNSVFSGIVLQPQICVKELTQNVYSQASNVLLATFLLCILFLYAWRAGNGRQRFK